MPTIAEGTTPTFFTCGELVVLDVDFDKCELNGFVNLQIVLNESFFEKRSFTDQNKHCIGVNLRSLMDPRKNIKIKNVMVDGVATKWYKRNRYTLRTQNIDISKLRDLANFDSFYCTDVLDIMDMGELLIKIPREVRRELQPFRKRTVETNETAYSSDEGNLEYELNSFNDMNDIPNIDDMGELIDDLNEPPKKRQRLNGNSNENENDIENENENKDDNDDGNVAELEDIDIMINSNGTGNHEMNVPRTDRVQQNDGANDDLSTDNPLTQQQSQQQEQKQQTKLNENGNMKSHHNNNDDDNDSWFGSSEEESDDDINDIYIGNKDKSGSVARNSNFDNNNDNDDDVDDDKNGDLLYEDKQSNQKHNNSNYFYDRSGNMNGLNENVNESESESDSASEDFDINETLVSKSTYGVTDVLLVRIEFGVSDPIEGIQWIVPRTTSDYKPYIDPTSKSNSNSKSGSVTSSSDQPIISGRSGTSTRDSSNDIILKKRGYTDYSVTSSDSSSISPKRDKKSMPKKRRNGSPNKMENAYNAEAIGASVFGNNNASGKNVDNSKLLHGNRAKCMYVYDCGWLPCVDSLRERYDFTLQISVPYGYCAIGCGKVISKQIRLESNEYKNVFVFKTEYIRAKDFGFIVGPFIEKNITSLWRSDDYRKYLPLSPMSPSRSGYDGNTSFNSTVDGSPRHNGGGVGGGGDGGSGQDSEDEGESKTNSGKKKKQKKQKNGGGDGGNENKQQQQVDDGGGQLICAELGEGVPEIKVYFLNNNDSIAGHNTSEEEVEHSCFAIPKMFECFEKYLENEYPFDCCNFVFIDECYSVGGFKTCGNLIMLSNDLLYDSSNIEQCYISNKLISQSIAESWMNHVVLPINLGDIWIKIGMTALVHLQWIELFEGKNEIEYMKTLWRFHRYYDGPHPGGHPKPPMGWNGFLHEKEIYVNYYDFYYYRSWFVLMMLENMIGSDSFRGNVILNCINVNTHGGSKFEDGISTKLLEKALFEVYAPDRISLFFRKWIYGDYFPRLFIKYGFDMSGRNTHGIVCKQCPIRFNDDLFDARRMRPGVTSDKIGQSIRIEVQETEYVTVEYVNVERAHFDDLVEFPCQTRKRRKNAKGDAPWTDAPAHNNTNVKWVRIDPYYDCLCHIVFYGISRRHAITQLLHDEVRDVKSQIEAISCLRITAHKNASIALLQCLRDGDNYYKVRLAAAKALAEDRITSTLDFNVNFLVDFVKEIWTQFLQDNKRKNGRNNNNNNSNNDDDKTNDDDDNWFENDKQLRERNIEEFGDDNEIIVNYFLVKHIPVYLSTVRTTREKHSMDNIIDLILDLLKESINVNGKDGIKFSLDNLVGAWIECLGNIEVSQTNQKKLYEISQIIHDAMQLQRIFPSKNEVIRGACINALLRLRLNNPTWNAGQRFLKYAIVVKYGKFIDSLRIKALECLALLSTFAQENSGLQDEYLRKIINAIRTEPIAGVAMKMIQTVHETYSKTIFDGFYQKEARVVAKQRRKGSKSHSRSMSQSVDGNENENENEIHENDDPELQHENLFPQLLRWFCSAFIGSLRRSAEEAKHRPFILGLWSLLSRFCNTNASNTMSLYYFWRFLFDTQPVMNPATHQYHERINKGNQARIDKCIIDFYHDCNRTWPQFCTVFFAQKHMAATKDEHKRRVANELQALNVQSP